MKITRDDILETLPNLSLQDLGVVEFKLNEHRARLKAQAIEVARAEMQQIASKAGLSLAEVLQDYAAPAPVHKAHKQQKRGGPTTARAKYANPEYRTQAWSGRGHQPRWLRQKIAEGRNLEEFLINGDARA
jgi:DNA-binding protein H-NS